MTNIPASDASNAAADAASIITNSLITDNDIGHANSEASQATISTGEVVANIPYAAAIPGSLPGSFTNYGLSSNIHIGASFILPHAGGLIDSALPFSLSHYWGPQAGPLSPNYVQGVGWEVKVFSGNSAFTYMTTIPRYESMSFNFELSNEGSGQIVIDRSDKVFNELMGTGGPGSDLYNYENVWQVLYNGTPIFEFLGTTADELIADASSEAQPITISGAGTARTLSWGETFPPGFPNVVYKLAALTDTFQVPDLDLVTWNLTPAASINSGQVYVDTNNSAAAIIGTPTDYKSSPVLASGYYDVTSSALSAKIVPLNMPSQPANLISNGSFVLGLTDWDTASSAAQSSGATAVPYTSDSFDGDGFCAQVTTTGANQGIEQAVPALLPNTTYWFNAWVKLQSGAGAVQLNIRDTTNGTGDWQADTTGIAVVGEWVLLTAAVSTGSTSNVNLLVSINSGTGAGATQFLVDTVNLFEFTNYTFNAMILKSASNSGYYVMMEHSSEIGLYAKLFENGYQVDTLYLTPYDSILHNYWRVREYAGTFFFDTAPDGGTWTNQGQLSYDWGNVSTNMSVSFTCWYYGFYGSTPGFTPMEVSNINSTNSPVILASGQVAQSANQGSITSGGYNVSAANSAGLQNAYLEMPNAGIWLDLFNQCTSRGTLSFIEPLFDKVYDSSGIAWGDQASIVISNGTNLENQLQASAAAFNGDWVMYPNFQLYMGNDGSLGTDRSSEVIFYSSGQIITHDRTRARDQIANYVVAADGTGNLAYQVDPGSRQSWNQREQYVQSSQATDIGTLQQLANATLLEFKSEVSQRTLQVPPELPGRTVFVDYQLGDWIGVQNPNLTDVDSVRVVGIAISIDGTQDYVTMELTLETRIQLMVERMNVLLQKIGATADAQVLAPPGASSILVQQSINTSAASNTYTQILGDGATTTFFIGHGLETQNVTVSVRDNSSGAIVAPGGAGSTYTVASTSIDQISITFMSAPSLNQYTLLVKK